MVTPDASGDAGSDATASMPCHVVGPGGIEPQHREIIQERPLRIFLNGQPLATVMYTPPGEVDLAMGFLLTEGIIRSCDEVGTVALCRDGDSALAGELRVQLVDGAAGNVSRGYREVLSSCSLCGDAWLESFADGVGQFERPAGRIRHADIVGLQECMSRRQEVFTRSGAAHAAAVAELPIDPDRSPVIVREDLGRHNALDKAVGAAAAAGVAMDRAMVMLSSRLSFEMVAKAARAGLSDVAGVSAPSSAAVGLAGKLGMFLAGFVRGQTMTVYTGIEALAASGE